MPRKRTSALSESTAVADTAPADKSGTGAFQGHPATRMRAADYVFETLSHAILNGELTPGSVLATQRELAQQFGVSPLVVRQATHRLEELGLVRVRQGSTTIVLDPNEASDVRLMQLQLELATPGDRLALAAIEMQSLSTLPMLALAERRITAAEVQKLDDWIEALPDRPTAREAMTFRLQFWGQIALATRNPVLQHQMRWWARVVRELEKRAATSGDATHWADGPGSASRTMYRALTRALRRKRGAVEAWHKVIVPVFEWAEARPNHPMHAQSTAAPRRARSLR